MWHWRTKFAHLDRQRINQIKLGEQIIGDQVGEPFQKERRIVDNDRDHPVANSAVVDRIVQVVANSGTGQIGFDVQVDAERLCPSAFLGQYTNHAGDSQVPKRDHIRRRSRLSVTTVVEFG